MYTNCGVNDEIITTFYSDVLTYRRRKFHKYKSRYSQTMVVIITQRKKVECFLFNVYTFFTENTL